MCLNMPISILDRFSDINSVLPIVFHNTLRERSQSYTLPLPSDFSYLMQMTRTTKIEYKECSHAKKTQKHGHRWQPGLICPTNCVHDSGTVLLAYLHHLKIWPIVASPVPSIPDVPCYCLLSQLTWLQAECDIHPILLIP